MSVAKGLGALSDFRNSLFLSATFCSIGLFFFIFFFDGGLYVSINNGKEK